MHANGRTQRIENIAERRWSTVVFSAMLSTLLATSPAWGETPANLPQWVYVSTGSDQQFQFEKTFSLPPGVQQASLRYAADFCSAAVTLNSLYLGVEAYCPTQQIDVTADVRQGENILKITTYDRRGPAAVALSLTVVGNDGKTQTIVTDRTWKLKQCDDKNAVELGAVRPELWGIGRRDASVSSLENYEQWRQASGSGKAPTQKFYTSEGFEVSLLRTAGADEGSWISLAFDPQGRALISREDQGFLRLTLNAERTKVAKVEPIPSDLKECRGLLFANDRLYANANNSKGMYTLNITNEGKIVDQKLLREFPGGTGHGRNDLVLGKDGRIYSIHGDSVETPKTSVVDRTSPLRESRVSEKPRQEGYVVSTDKDGKSWELLCTGLRNPYGIAVSPNGDLFTYDADNEFDAGTPWYRPTRIVQLFSGADYGYRVSKDNRRPNWVDQPDNAVPLIDVGRGSPTAAMFGTELKFPAPYHEALFVLDWTYGRVLAVHMAPRGGGYRASLETFLQGRPLNVTDLAAGPDGAMYLITGGRKTQSSLYRVAFTGKMPAPVVESKHELAAAKFSEAQRAVLRRLENLHGETSTPANADLLKLAIDRLDDADPTIRHAARVAVERRPPASWQLAALVRITKEVRAPYQLETAALRTGNPLVAAAFVTQMANQPLRDWALSVSDRFTVLALLERAEKLAPAVVEKHRKDLVRMLELYWPCLNDAEFRRSGDSIGYNVGFRVGPYGTNREFRRRLALLLAAWKSPRAVELITRDLLGSDVQEDRLTGLVALSKVREGWTPATRRVFFQALNDGSRFVSGQGMPGFLDQIRSDAVATLTPEEKQALADVITPPKVKDEPLPPQRPLVQKWKLEELAQLAGDATTDGDATRGAVLFHDALCSRCHRAGLNGPAVGPDLSFVARRFSRRDILQSIVLPSAAVAEQYRNSEIITDEGKVLTGRVVSEGDYRSEKLLINIDPLRPSQVVEVDKKQIAEHRMLGTSPMPEGLLDGFTAEQIRDLLAFLEAGPAVTPSNSPPAAGSGDGKE